MYVSKFVSRKKVEGGAKERRKRERESERGVSEIIYLKLEPFSFSIHLSVQQCIIVCYIYVSSFITKLSP